MAALDSSNSLDEIGPDRGLATRAAARLARALRVEQLAGLRLAAHVRLGALAVIAVWLWFLTNAPALYYYEAGVMLLAASGLAHQTLEFRHGTWRWLPYAFVTLDCVIMALAMFGPSLVIEGPWPPQMFLRNGTFIYFFIIVAGMTLSYSPALVLWAGFTSALCWSAGVAWMLFLPDTKTLGRDDFEPPAAALASVLDPHFVDIDPRLQDVILVLVVAGIIAVAVARTRRLVLQHAMAERERANLSRYFPPSLVDQLSQVDEPLGAVRAQPVAVLFADIVGFTRLAEHWEPERVIALLRSYHARLERAVFDHQGTLDKFLGDGLMATFGTPMSRPQDPANAIACARTILTEIETWNEKRRARGQAPIIVSVGIHYGEVVLGDIGSERRLEFTVVGDVVNVASRLEESTRRLGCRVAASDEVVAAARRTLGAEADGLLEGFTEAPPQVLRGRSEPVRLWTLGGGPQAA